MPHTVGRSAVSASSLVTTTMSLRSRCTRMAKQWPPDRLDGMRGLLSGAYLAVLVWMHASCFAVLAAADNVVSFSTALAPFDWFFNSLHINFAAADALPSPGAEKVVPHKRDDCSSSSLSRGKNICPGVQREWQSACIRRRCASMTVHR